MSNTDIPKPVERLLPRVVIRRESEADAGEDRIAIFHADVAKGLTPAEAAWLGQALIDCAHNLIAVGEITDVLADAQRRLWCLKALMSGRVGGDGTMQSNVNALGNDIEAAGRSLDLISC